MKSATKLALVSALVGAAALGAVGCKGKGAAGGCDQKGDCGGNPVGEWRVSDICNLPVVSRPVQNYENTSPYYQPETGVPAPAMTSGNWCWSLMFDEMGDISAPALPMPKPDVVVGGHIIFNEDRTYIYELTAKSTTRMHLARSCFGVNGHDVTCAQLATKLMESGIGVNPVYSNDTGTPAFACVDAGDGCDCTFDFIETEGNSVGDKGRWVVDGNVIHHYSIAGQGVLFETNPARRTTRDATFCVSDDGNTLDLAGTNGQPLALKVGLRTLTLTRVLPDAGTDAEGVTDAGVEAGVEASAPDVPADGADDADGTDAADDVTADAQNDGG